MTALGNGATYFTGDGVTYVFLAANQLSSYYTGEVIAALGGETLPG